MYDCGRRDAAAISDAVSMMLCCTRRVFVCFGKAGLQLAPVMCLHAKVSGSLSTERELVD